MKILFAILCSVLAISVVACGYAKIEKGKNIVCDQQYAICSSSQCIPDPSHPNEVICFCEVLNGKSFGQTACDKRAPYIDENGVGHVISTYSFHDSDSKKFMTCPSGSPWANCLDQPCTIDPLDPSKAICTCKIVRTGVFQTLGGNCDQSTCDKGYWSGATPNANKMAGEILMKALGLRESPQRFCPE